MHSLKNTFVAVVLLGVSYFVYDGITQPDPKLNAEAGEGLDLEMPVPEGFEPLASTANLPEKTVANKLSELKVPQREDFSSNFKPNKLSSQPATQPPAQPLQFAPHSSVTPQPTRPALNLPKLAPSANSFVAKDANQFKAAPTTSNDFSPRPAAAPELNTTSPFNAKTELTPIAPRSFPNQQAFLETSPYAPNNISQTGNFVATQPTTQPTTRPANPPSPVVSAAKLTSTWPLVDDLVQQGRYRRALETLTPFYDATDLARTDAAKLLDNLDRLAGRVIYSPEHNLTQSAYIIQPNDSLQSIAAKWNVPAQLIYNINKAKIANPLTLMPGNELKVVNGPFQARIDSDSNTLTLFLNNMYAGRFSAKVNSTQPGTYEIRSKVAKGDPLGSFTLSLTDPITGATTALHTSSGPQDRVGLNASDAQDLFGILSVGSKITIQ